MWVVARAVTAVLCTFDRRAPTTTYVAPPPAPDAGPSNVTLLCHLMATTRKGNVRHTYK